MACLPKLKCFRKEDGSDMQQKSNDARTAAAANAETKEQKPIPGRRTDARMEQCAKWLRKVSTIAEHEESNLYSPKYLPPSTYLNNRKSNVVRPQSLHSLDPDCLGHVLDKMSGLKIDEPRDDAKYPHTGETSGGSSSDISSISSSIEFKRKRKKKRLRTRSGHAVSKHLAAHRRLSGVSDSTIDSTISCSMMMRTESVVLDLDRAGTNLGISVVGHQNCNGDQGIFVGTVRRDGVAFASGRIRPGSCLLEVNGQDLTKLSNERALRTMRTEAQRKGPLHLVLGKFWDVGSASKNEDFEESCLEEQEEEAVYRPQEMAKLTYVQPNYCPPMKCQMAASTCSMAPPYVMAPPATRTMSTHSSKPSNRARRQSDRTRNEPKFYCQWPDGIDDHSRRHSLPGILGPNFSEFLPLPPPPIPPRPYNPGFESLSSSAYLPHGTDPRGGLAIDSPQTLFRGIDLIEWIANRFSSHIDGISPREFSQHLLEKGAIVDVDQSGNKTQFSENGYYVIVSSHLSDKQIVI